jgi:hypothetical protein
MTMKNIQCSLAGLGRTAALQDQGRHGFDGVTTSGHCGIREDSGPTGPGMAWVISVMGSGNGAGCTMLWAQGGCHYCGLGNGVMGLGTRHAWLMVSPAQVEEDGSA